MVDTDHDGTIDMKEAQAAASALFARLDRDHDGTLDIKELRGHLTLREFRAAGPAKDGTLTEDEFLSDPSPISAVLAAPSRTCAPVTTIKRFFGQRGRSRSCRTGLPHGGWQQLPMLCRTGFRKRTRRWPECGR
jgi:EF hand